MGSIPAAYIAGRLITGRDIRKLGGGNVGADNTFRQVGKTAGTTVALFDIGKGAAAVLMAQWLLAVPLGDISISAITIDSPQVWVLLAGLAVICGHIWSIYLKFTGGNGLATTIGVLAVLLPMELLIAIAIIPILVLITRNLILSSNIGLMSVLVSTAVITRSGLLITFCAILFLVLSLHFLPTALVDIAHAGSKHNFVNRLLRRNKE